MERSRRGEKELKGKDQTGRARAGESERSGGENVGSGGTSASGSVGEAGRRCLLQCKILV